MGIRELLREEFQLRYLGFDGFKPIHFHTSLIGEKRFIVYRVVVLLYWMSMLVARIASTADFRRFCFFLSNWNQTMLGVYFLFACFSAVHGRMNIKHTVITSSQVAKHINTSSEDVNVINTSLDSSNVIDTSSGDINVINTSSEATNAIDTSSEATNVIDTLLDVEKGKTKVNRKYVTKDVSLRWFHIVTCVFHVTGFSVSIFVSLMYGAMEWKKDSGTLDWSFQNINLHFINSVIMVVEVCVNNQPIRLLHFIYVMAFTLIYDLYVLTLHLVGLESALYKIVDWENNVTVAVCFVIIMIFIVSPFTHIIMFVIKRVVTSCCRHKRVT